MATNPDVSSSAGSFVTFEDRLARDAHWAMSEGSLFFENKGAVQESLRRIARRLDELGIPYAVAGGMALFHHGYRRFTEDVDILVTRDGLRAIHRALDGLGYKRPFEKSKNLRDVESKVKIEFLVAGEFPGDGKPKAVQFPNPKAVAVEIDGIKFLSLPALIELKLASGISGVEREKDLIDVQQLIKTLNLPLRLSNDLAESVRPKYIELWNKLDHGPKRFVRTWRNKFLTSEAKSLGEMVQILQAAAQELSSMLADGVTLDPNGGTGDDYALLVTTDPLIAKKYDMEDESQSWDDAEDAGE
jgi:hypothetical protein